MPVQKCLSVFADRAPRIAVSFQSRSRPETLLIIVPKKPIRSADAIYSTQDTCALGTFAHEWLRQELLAEQDRTMIQRIGQYNIVEKLSEGQKGILYKAYDNAQSRPVALRTVAPDLASDAVSEETFYRACQSAAKLRHPNIIEIYAVGKEAGVTYVAMELLEGNDLRSLITEHSQIPLEAKLSVMIQMADALLYAHNNGVSHHNLRPSKVHITPAGIIKLRGFGFPALFLSRPDHAEPCSEEPLYSAPEQILGKASGTKADIFAAGMLYYELLTYTYPFSDPQSGNASERILSQSEIATVDKYPDLPLGCWPILEKCLEKDPKDRFDNIGEVGRACRDLLQDLTEASDLMLRELKSAVPFLEAAVERPGSGIKLAKLLWDVHKLLQSDESLDHLSLQGLMTSLASHSALLRSVSLDVMPAPVMLKSQASTRETIPYWIIGRLAQQDDSGGAVEEQSKPASTLPVRDASDIPLEEAGTSQEQNPQESTAEELLMRIHSTIAETRQFVDSQMIDEHREQAVAAPEQCDSRPIEETGNSVESVGTGAGSQVQADQARTFPWASGERKESAGRHNEERPNDSVPTTTFAAPPVSSVTQPSHSIAARHRMVLWIAGGILLVIVAFGAELWIRKSSGAPTDDEVQLQAAKMSLDQKSYDETIRACLQILAKSPEDAQAKSLLDQAREGKRLMAVDTLLKKAQGLIAQGHSQESRALLQATLQLDPGNATALLLIEGVKPGIADSGNEGSTEQEIATSIANATAFLKSGKLDQAKTEIDKVLRLDGSNPQALTLRKQWAARNADLPSQKEDKQQEEMSARRRHENEIGWTRKAQGLYRQGKYSELLALLDQWLTENPQSDAANILRAQTVDTLRSIQSYETALKDKRYDDALSEIDKVELINPGDPVLAELRKRAELRKAAARASLSVYRIGEPAVLTLDDQPIGSNGEVEHHSIPVGRHKVAIRNSRGHEAARSPEFMDGQSALMVYDAAGPVLRVMTDSDRDLVNNRKAAEEVHRYPVEHKHTWLRGKCEGDLVISYNEIEYRPKLGKHGFRIPFRSLYLKAEGQRIEVFFAADNTELRIFDVQTAAQAKAAQSVWEDLKALRR